MVQIIQENRRPSFTQKLNAGIGAGLEIGSDIMQQRSNQKEKEQTSKMMQKAGQQLLGIDISSFDPETQKALLVEGLKQKGKGELMGEKQAYLDKILGGGRESKKQLSENEPGNKSFDFSNISDEDIIRAEQMGVKGIREAKNAKIKETEGVAKEKRRTFESDRDYHSKTSEPILKEAQSVVKEAPIKKGLIDQQRRDIASGQTEGIIPFLVERTGADIYRNPESARFKTASKQRFIESLHSLGAAGARANQFIEQQLVGAQATLGRDQESNQTVLDLEEFVDDLKNQRAKFELEEAEKDVEKYGYPRNDIARRADKKMTQYADQRQDEMAYDIRRRHEQNMSDESLTQEIIGKKVTPDTPLTLRAARILMIKNNDDERKAQAEAKKLGFRLPTEQTYRRG